MHLGRPPFSTRNDGTPLGEDAWNTLPQALKDEVLHARATQTPEEFYGPCYWLDMETRKCRHYDLRPRVCREFEVGTKYCLRFRKDFGFECLQFREDYGVDEEGYHQPNLPNLLR